MEQQMREPTGVVRGDMPDEMVGREVPRVVAHASAVLEARRRLEFLVDAATGRGAVTYRRYDGHYGIVDAS